MVGKVMKSTGSWYSVRTEAGQVIPCRIRGKIRLEGILETNPVAVGDNVELESDTSGGVITAIRPRQNHMLRQAVKKAGHSHVLAANVDLAAVVASLELPRTSLGFIDRFLVSAESFRIPQAILFNKTDLLTDVHLRELESVKSLYAGLGITVLAFSATTSPDLGEVSTLFRNRTTLLAGHSGVGKSTLLNRLAPHLAQAVKEVSAYTEKGVHTTTFAEMLELEPNTFVIDTPGVKEWGLVDMSRQEISDYFPEMRELRLSCKFGSRCLHLQEPQCAIRAAAESGLIAASRYESYFNMVTGKDNRK
jgi:ribosome biogenesis GTPase